MTRYTVQKGGHVFRLWGVVPALPRIRHGVETMTWLVRFDPNCAYSLPGEEWKDWNKGGGVSFDLFDNHVDSTMWAWRYNPVTGMVQLTAYSHVDGERPRIKNSMYSQRFPMEADGEVAFATEFGFTTRISLQIDREESRYDWSFMAVGAASAWPASQEFDHNRQWSRDIGGWFGGKNDKTGKQTVAPHRMDIGIEKRQNRF
jgi:hypothetical protein